MKAIKLDKQNRKHLIFSIIAFIALVLMIITVFHTDYNFDFGLDKLQTKTQIDQ